jgi:hypothetical protein
VFKLAQNAFNIGDINPINMDYSSKFKAVISRHGSPQLLIMDKEANFKSVFEKFGRVFNSEIKLTPPTHHQANGKIERFIQCLKNSLPLRLTLA